jgi:hypothetical protein
VRVLSFKRYYTKGLAGTRTIPTARGIELAARPVKPGLDGFGGFIVINLRIPPRKKPVLKACPFF